MGEGLTLDSLPPLEASVTGIEEARAAPSRPSASVEASSATQSSPGKRRTSSASQNKRPFLHRYWNALHQAVAPELSLVPSEDNVPSNPDTPLASAQLRDSNQNNPFNSSASAASPSRPSSATSRRRGLSDAADPAGPKTETATTSISSSGPPARAEFLAVDRDFDTVLLAPPSVDADGSPLGLAVGEASPRNSTFGGAATMSRSESSHNASSNGRDQARPGMPSNRISSGNITTVTETTATYPPTSIDPADALSLSAGHGPGNSRKSCLLRAIKFLSPSFDEPNMEKAFRKETWQVLKPAAIASSTIVFLLWIAFCASRPIHWPLFKALFFGIDMSFNVLMVVLIGFDLYLKSSWIYQFIAFVNCWALPCTVLAASYECHFFFKLDHSSSICPPDRDFLSVLLWPLAFPVIHLFLLSAWRGPVAFGFCIWLVFAIWSISGHGNESFGVNLINVTLFQLAILWVSLLKERSDRHLFLLHERVRRQFRQTKTAQRRERTAETSKQAFVSYIFHEVRIPLNAALLACQNLEAENLLGRMPEHKAMARGLSSSLLTMQRVLNDILDYQKMESKRLTWVPAPFNLHNTMKSVIDSYRPFADSRKLSVVADLDPRVDRLSCAVMGDPQRVAQAFSNLVSNACKWGKSKVQCRTQLLFPLASSPLDVPVRAALIRVEVQDDGEGLSSADLADQKLFSPYVQTETQLQAGGKGAGLGLALTKENIKLAGGRLGVDSQPGHGATFWFEMVFGMPLERAEPTTLAVTPIVPPTYILGTPDLSSDPPSPGLRPEKTSLQILVVDDDPLTCKLMQRMLNRQGHRSIVASSGAEAVRIIKESKSDQFDLALLDGNIGDMTGWDCLRQLREHGFGGYACGLSGSGDAKEPFDAAGAKKTILKPLNGDALDRLLGEVLRYRGFA